MQIYDYSLLGQFLILLMNLVRTVYPVQNVFSLQNLHESSIMIRFCVSFYSLILDLIFYREMDFDRSTC